MSWIVSELYVYIYGNKVGEIQPVVSLVILVIKEWHVHLAGCDFFFFFLEGVSSIK